MALKNQILSKLLTGKTVTSPKTHKQDQSKKMLAIENGPSMKRPASASASSDMSNPPKKPKPKASSDDESQKLDDQLQKTNPEIWGFQEANGSVCSTAAMH